LPILEEYPTFQNDLLTMLQKMRSVEQLLYTFIVQPILKCMIKSLIDEVICLMVNSDKIGIHLVLIVRERTCENKGTKKIQVLKLRGGG
jgi:hypothetical protein